VLRRERIALFAFASLCRSCSRIFVLMFLSRCTTTILIEIKLLPSLALTYSVRMNIY